MQQRDFNLLKEQLGEEIGAHFPDGAGDAVRSKVARALDRMNADNKLMALPEDEYHLLLDYRLWKASPKAATGIFHWRRRP
jgi:hypothetical protein